MVKKPPANLRGIRDMGLIPGSGRSSGRGYGNSLQYSCLEDPLAEESDWLCSIGSQSQTRLKRLSMYAQ